MTVNFFPNSASLAIKAANLRSSVKGQGHKPHAPGAGGGVGLGWVVARTGGGFPRPVCPSLTSTTGPYPGCLVSQPPRLLTIPEPHQGAGGREILPCLCVCRARSGHAGGSGHWVRAQLHTFCLHWAAVLLSVCGGGMCVPGALGPSSREPYTKAAGGVCRWGDLRLPPAHDCGRGGGSTPRSMTRPPQKKGWETRN